MTTDSEGSLKRAVVHDGGRYCVLATWKLLWKLVVKTQETLNYRTGSSLIHRPTQHMITTQESTVRTRQRLHGKWQDRQKPATLLEAETD